MPKKERFQTRPMGRVFCAILDFKITSFVADSSRSYAKLFMCVLWSLFFLSQPLCAKPPGDASQFASWAIIGDNGGMSNIATRPIKQQVNTKTLDPHEWNFRDVPDDQLEACYLYEYAREFYKTSKHLQKFYEEWSNPKNKQKGKYLLTLIKAWDLLKTRRANFPHIFFEYFPANTWQGLPEFMEGAPKAVRENLRQSLSDHVNDWSKRFRKSRFDRLYIGTLREFEPPNVHSLEDFQLLYKCSRNLNLDNVEYGFFAINWDFKDAQLIKAFNDWLNDQREARRAIGLKDARPTVSRGGFKDKLNWLGALRVKNHFKKKDLVEYNDTNLKVDAPFCHYPDLLDAARKAADEIHRLFPAQWSEEDYRRREAESARYHKNNPLILPIETQQSLNRS